jgi:DNA-binding MarR family transcriptional regulator
VSDQPKNIDYGVLPDLIGYQVRLAQQRIFRNFEQHFAPHGLTPGLLGVLILVDRNPGLSQSALAQALGLERSTMVAVIDRLERQEMVARVASATDRRTYGIQLHPKMSAERMAELMQTLAAHERDIANGLSQETITRTGLRLAKLGK